MGYAPPALHLPSNCLSDSNATLSLYLDDDLVSSTYLLVEDMGLVGWRVLLSIEVRREKREMDLSMNLPYKVSGYR